jgi:hypothetical protein
MPRSWKFYRYAVCYCLGELVAPMFIVRTEESSLLPPRNSRKRSNQAQSDQLNQLLLSIRQSGSAHKQLATLWLECSFFVGLRPQEWTQSTIIHIDAEPYLKVKTIVKGPKSSENFREHRYIPLMQFHYEDYQKIRSLCDVMHKNKRDYQVMYKACRKIIYEHSRITFGNKTTIALYTGRQQFAANLKKSKISKKAIMYALGHANVETQRHHYAPTYVGELISFPEEKCIYANEKLAINQPANEDAE